MADHLGRVRAVLWVKGSGADLAASGAGDYPALWLDELVDLQRLDGLSDERMTDLLRSALVDPASRRPSIETLLHAFLPYDYVDHVHADAVVVLTKAPDPAAVVAAALGDRVGYVPWLRPGFKLARAVARMADLDGVVLGHHGLVTWADEDAACLARTRELVAAADGYLSDALGSEWPSSAESGRDALGPDELARMLLRLRAALSSRSRRVLHVDRRLREVADRADVATLAAAGVATADHMLRIGPRAAALRGSADAAHVVHVVHEHEEDYRAYFSRHEAALPDGSSMHDPAPRALLVPGLGAVLAAPSERAARVAADVLLHTSLVAARAMDAWGEAATMTEDEVFGVDYWPLELDKLTLAPPLPELAGHVVCVSGAASGIGRAVADRLGALGAHLVVADVDGDALRVVAARIEGAGGARPEAVVGDISHEAVVDEMVARGVRRFGGLDGVVVNAGTASAADLVDLDVAAWRHVLETNLTSAMLLTRAALRVFRTQGMGGSIVYVASKNAFGPGGGFGAYSVSKAGMVQLMRVAAIEGARAGVRANAVNPDAVFEGSKLWSEDLRHQRAAAHGVEPRDLEDFYAARSLLGVPVSARDVAEAVVFLLSARSAKTTGAVVPVDGGVPSAFPR